MDEEYDFYYSQKHWEHLRKISQMSISEKKERTFMGEIEYTETIRKGRKPLTKNFGDLKKVYTGKFEWKNYKSQPY
jgi:hypothetical protein